MKRRVTKEENQTKQEDNIYNHNRKNCTTLAGVISISSFLMNQFETNEDEFVWSDRGVKEV